MSQQKIQGFRVYTPRNFGSSNTTTRQLVIGVLLEDKNSAFTCPDRYSGEFQLSFQYNTENSYWWKNATLEVRTEKPEVLQIAAKFYTEFAAYCEKNMLPDQTPLVFANFAATKKIPQVWYDANVGRLFTNPQTKSFAWSYNGQPYGNVLATNEKMALAKIRRSYPTGYVELTEQPLDLREYNRFQLGWLLAI